MNTALLVFSLSSKKEQERKNLSFFSNQDKNSKIYDLLISRTREVAMKSGIDVLWFDESVQRGKGFSERLTNAFSDAFEMGYENVISIGNDCPDLSVNDLINASYQVQEKGIVLGPATDGGVYLIGINNALFNPSGFKELPWLKTNLFATIQQKLKDHNIGFYCLETHSDIDSKKDITCFIAHKPKSIFARKLQNLLFRPKIQHANLYQCFKSAFYIYHLPLRAPPAKLKSFQ